MAEYLNHSLHCIAMQITICDLYVAIHFKEWLGQIMAEVDCSCRTPCGKLITEEDI